MTASRRNLRARIAWRAAQDFHDGACVNLGIGIPSEASRFVPDGVEVVFQSENGVLGMGAIATAAEVDRNLINASQQFVTLRPGGCFFDCCDSFAMLRGGHIDIAFLGAFEVTEGGDLANWDRNDRSVPPAVGGAMDIAVGAKRIWVGMEHCTEDGRPRLVRRTALPITGAGVVDRVYTNLAVIDMTDDGPLVREILPGWSPDRLRDVTEWRLTFAADLRDLAVPDFEREGDQT